MILDLSHEISAGLLTYPGLPPPAMRTVVTREGSGARLPGGVSFEVRLVDVPVALVHALDVTSIGRESLGEPGRLAGRVVTVCQE